MRRTPVLALVTIAASVVCLCLAPSVASAYELSVVAPGSAELDFGDASTARLAHGTLERSGDRFTMSVHGVAGDPITIELLVPDDDPEGSAPRSALPQVAGFHEPDRATLRDPVTNIRYRVVGTMSTDGSVPALVIGRGSKPSRFAVFVHRDGARFRADHPDRTPRTLLRLQEWAHAGSTPKQGDTGSPTFRAWYAAGLAAIAVLVAVWWVWVGKVRSRVRGVERARED